MAIAVQVDGPIAIQIQEHRITPRLIDEPFLGICDTLLQNSGLDLIGVERIAYQSPEWMIDVHIRGMNRVNRHDLAINRGHIVILVFDHRFVVFVILLLLLLLVLLLECRGVVELIILHGPQVLVLVRMGVVVVCVGIHGLHDDQCTCEEVIVEGRGEHMLIGILLFLFAGNTEDGEYILLVDHLALKLHQGLLGLLAKPFENIGCLCGKGGLSQRAGCRNEECDNHLDSRLPASV